MVGWGFPTRNLSGSVFGSIHNTLILGLRQLDLQAVEEKSLDVFESY